jgi:hypothetical protein
MIDPKDLTTVEQGMAKQAFRKAASRLPADILARIRQDASQIAALEPHKAAGRLAEVVQQYAPKGSDGQLVDRLAGEAATCFQMTLTGFSQHFRGEQLRSEVQEYVVRLLVGCWTTMNEPQFVEPQHGDQMVCFSYVPLLYPPSPAGCTYDGESAKTLFESETFAGQPDLSAAVGCIWLQSETEHLMPVFLMRRGREIAEHLTTWSEGQPDKWFTLDLAAARKGYAVVLAPDVQMSIARYRVAYRLRHGHELPEDVALHVVCRPLHFVTEHGATSNPLEHEISAQLPLGILDQAEFDPADPEGSIRRGSITELGPFQVRWNPEETASFLKELLDSTSVPPKPATS